MLTEGNTLSWVFKWKNAGCAKLVYPAVVSGETVEHNISMPTAAVVKIRSEFGRMARIPHSSCSLFVQGYLFIIVKHLKIKQRKQLPTRAIDAFQAWQWVCTRSGPGSRMAVTEATRSIPSLRLWLSHVLCSWHSGCQNKVGGIRY